MRRACQLTHGGGRARDFVIRFAPGGGRGFRGARLEQTAMEQAPVDDGRLRIGIHASAHQKCGFIRCKLNVTQPISTFSFSRDERRGFFFFFGAEQAKKAEVSVELISRGCKFLTDKNRLEPGEGRGGRGDTSYVSLRFSQEVNIRCSTA